MTSARVPGKPDRWTRALLRCGLAAGPVFIAAFCLEGVVRDDGYRPLRHPVSALAPSPPTRTGTAHNLSAIPVFIGLPVAALACGRRSWRTGQRGFGLYSAGTAVTMLVTMALAGSGFGGSPQTAPRLVTVGGLFQRASIISGFAWLTAVSARALHRLPAPAARRDYLGQAPAGGDLGRLGKSPA